MSRIFNLMEDYERPGPMSLAFLLLYTSLYVYSNLQVCSLSSIKLMCTLLFELINSIAQIKFSNVHINCHYNYICQRPSTILNIHTSHEKI